MYVCVCIPMCLFVSLHPGQSAESPHVGIDTCICVYVHAYMHRCLFFLNMYVCVYIPMCLCVSLHPGQSAESPHVGIYIYMYMCICACIHA